MSKYVTVSTTNTWDTKYATVSDTWAIKDTVTSYFTHCAVGTIWEHAQKEFQEFLKIRITLNLLFHKRMICRGKPVQKVDSGNWVLILQIAQDEKHLNFFCFG